MTEVWTVHRTSDNHVVGVYDNEESAAVWYTKWPSSYYYEHWEVDSE